MKHFYELNKKIDYGVETTKIIKVINKDKLYLETFNESILFNNYSGGANTIEEYIEQILKVKEISKINKEKFLCLLEFLYNIYIYIDVNYAKENNVFHTASLIGRESNQTKIRKMNNVLGKNIDYLVLKMNLIFVKNNDNNLYVLHNNSMELEITKKDFEKETYDLIKDYQKARLIDDIKDRVYEKRKTLTQLANLIDNLKYDKYFKNDSTFMECGNLLNNTYIRHYPQNKFLEMYLKTLSDKDYEKIYDYTYNLIVIILYKKLNQNSHEYIKQLKENIANCSKQCKSE